MANEKNINQAVAYDDDAIKTLSPREHLRLRPGMYIGKLGDGSQPDDGIYVLIKETVDNSIDEFIMGAGNRIEITIEDNVVSVRDYGRGIPLKSLSAAVSKMNTGGKYEGDAFKKTVGLNGVGVKAVNMLSSEFTARSVRDGEAHTVSFAQGLELSDRWESGVDECIFREVRGQSSRFSSVSAVNRRNGRKQIELHHVFYISDNYQAAKLILFLDI